jgi:hypothetical protein
MGGTFVIADKHLSPQTTTGDGTTTTLTLTSTPYNSSYAAVFVNGWMAWVANGAGEQATADCFFSSDGGTTAKAYGSFASGDTLYWNGVQVGFELVNGTHFVDFLYGTA